MSDFIPKLHEISDMKDADHKLKERVKELNCLYEISKVALDANNDVDALVAKTLQIIPAAMQYPDLAETQIQIATAKFSTSGFDRCKLMIQARLNIDKNSGGTIKVGYKQRGRRVTKLRFLPEERNLLKTIARELSLFIKKASIEEEKEKLQLQYQHLERLAFVGELSAGIAHELNEPLAKILGFAQLIKKAGSLNDQQTEDIERIVKASLFTREIIKKLMIFSRQMPPQITKINLNEIIGNILYFIDVRFHSRGIKLRTRLDKRLPAIKGDEVQMSQVLVNLITNAVHAMPNGGQITVVTKVKDKFVSLIVSDTGHGMTSAVRQKIFEPFFTTKSVGQGTGLGLAVVKSIIDSHHGKITVNSSPGAGTKFEILLPFREQ
jgi:two-component system, NtrC family, sensor kinase